MRKATVLIAWLVLLAPEVSAVGNVLFITAHLDFFNPFALYGLGLVPHVVVDYMLGHIIQWLGGSFGC
jgi:hypothetical protein